MGGMHAGGMHARLGPVVVATSLAVAVAVAGACSSSGGGAAGADAGPVARFVPGDGASPPRMLDVPFPSDVYRGADGRVGAIPAMELVLRNAAAPIARELGSLDGFSRVGHAFFYLDDATRDAGDLADGDPVGFMDVDPASLPRDEAACVADASSVALLDLATGARVPCRAAYHDDTPFGSSARPVLAVGPARGVVLDPGARYAAVVTTRLRDRSGRAVRASDAFTAARDAIVRPALDRATSILAGALAADGASIVAIAPFTTHTREEELFALRETLEASPPPALAWDAASLAPMGAAKFGRAPLPPGFTATLDDWLGVVAPKAKLADGADDPDALLPVRAHDRIAAVGTAAFAAPNFLRDEPGGYDTPGHATFARDASGGIVPFAARPTSKIWATFAMPTGAMPPAGWPAIVLVHGAGESRAQTMSLANAFAAEGWVVAAIDMPTFGARAPRPEYRLDAHTDYESAPGATYKGPDGIADAFEGGRNGPIEFSGGVANMGAFRDQLRQAAIDVVTFVRVLRNKPDLSPLAPTPPPPPPPTPAATIDPDRIAVVANSLGSTVCAVAAAIEPSPRAWVLNVGGAPVLLEAGNQAGQSGRLYSAGTSLVFGFSGGRMSPSNPVVNLLETSMEAGDPIVYARALVTSPRALLGKAASPRNVMLVEVVYDELMANEGTEALARAAGLALASPNLGSNAGITDPRSPLASVGLVPFAIATPDASGAIAGVPRVDATGLLVQISPAEHGTDLVQSRGKRQTRIPYALFSTDTPFSPLGPDEIFTVSSPYRELQASVRGFVRDAFAGRVPAARGLPAPRRDFDDDGTPDATDPDPSNPTIR